MGGEGETKTANASKKEERWWLPTKEAEISMHGRTVRTIMKVCVAMHLLFFSFELFLYDWIFSMMFTELFLGWFAYFCAMKMNRAMIVCYAICLAIHGFLGIMGVIDVGGWFLVYMCQIGVYGLVLWWLFLEYMKWGDKEKESKQKKKEEAAAKK